MPEASRVSWGTQLQLQITFRSKLARKWQRRFTAVRERATQFLQTTYLGEISTLCPPETQLEGTVSSVDDTNGDRDQGAEAADHVELILDDPLDLEEDADWD